jgi:hypothetical protein
MESEKTLSKFWDSTNVTPVGWSIFAGVSIIIIVSVILAGLTAQQKSSAVQQLELVESKDKDVWDLAQQSLTAQQKSSAVQHGHLVPVDERDLSSPSSRLVGHWENVDNNGEIYYTAIDPDLKIGTFRLAIAGGPPGRSVYFRVISEELSGNTVIIRDFRDFSELEAKTGLDFSRSDIVCRISKDGQSMTQEYILSHRHRMFSVYRYSHLQPIDDKTAP